MFLTSVLPDRVFRVIFFSDTVITASPWTLAAVSITPVTIPAGATQAFYITLDGSGDVLYGIGTQSLTAVVAEDDRMVIYEGPAKVYQFGGQTSPRVWNGEFTYLRENGVVATLAPTKRPTNSPTNLPTTAKPTSNPTSRVSFHYLGMYFIIRDRVIETEWTNQAFFSCLLVAH